MLGDFIPHTLLANSLSLLFLLLALVYIFGRVPFASTGTTILPVVQTSSTIPNDEVRLGDSWGV